ncbi:MAG: UMP kinase [Elusimicrobia bacterium]|nr:UMP kinase [Elusimicrobiota bacterium]
MTKKRVLLKLSGETLSGDGKSVSTASIQTIADEIKSILSDKVELSIVVGAGNLWRGAGKTINRASADKIGMLATVMNAIAISEVLIANGMKSVVLSAAGVTNFCETFSQAKAIEYLSKGYVVVFAGGTGNPYFTTDTTAALRACEIKADIILKATQVDGVYTADPKKDLTAKKYDKISYKEAIDKNLKIMDISAFLLCMENNIEIYVFDFHKKGNLKKVLDGENVGTVIY